VLRFLHGRSREREGELKLKGEEELDRDRQLRTELESSRAQDPIATLSVHFVVHR
jgi:hypothetical protein